MFSLFNTRKRSTRLYLPEKPDAEQQALDDFFMSDHAEELQSATWEEIDAIAERIHGHKPVMQRSDERIPCAGSPYIMNNRIGSLEDSNARWEQLGNS